MEAFVKIDVTGSDRTNIPNVSSSLRGRGEPIFTRAFALLLLMWGCFGFCFSGFFILPKFLTLQLGANAEQIGLITAAAGIIPLLSLPFIGSWIDRYGRKQFIIAGVGVNALASLVFVWVDVCGPLLYTLRVLQGLSFTLALNAAVTVVADISPRERLGQALGFFGVASMVTNGITPFILEPIADVYGYKPVFLFSGAAGLVSFAFACALSEPAVVADVRSHKHTGGSELSLNLMAATLVSSCAVGAAFGAMFAFFQPFALELGISQVRGFFVGFSLAAITTRLGLGGLTDRLGHRRVSIGAMLIYGAVVIAMAWLRPGILEWLGVGFGLAHGVIYPALNALAVESVSESTRGQAMTYYGGAFAAGNTVSVWALGWLAGRVGFPPIFVFSGLMVIAAAGILIVKK